MFWAIVTSVPRWLVGRGARVATTPSQSVNDTNPIPPQLISMSPCAPQICRCIKSWSRVDRVCMTLRSMEQFEPSVPRQGSVNFLIRDVPVSAFRRDRTSYRFARIVAVWRVGTASPSRRDRQFEAPFLQRRVNNEPSGCAAGCRPPARVRWLQPESEGRAAAGIRRIVVPRRRCASTAPSRLRTRPAEARPRDLRRLARMVEQNKTVSSEPIRQPSNARRPCKLGVQ